ncbi:Hypothetical predicted protein, partial [Pelobates cultripes]
MKTRDSEYTQRLALRPSVNCSQVPGREGRYSGPHWGHLTIHYKGTPPPVNQPTSWRSQNGHRGTTQTTKRAKLTQSWRDSFEAKLLSRPPASTPHGESVTRA